MSAARFLRHSLAYAASQYVSRAALIARGVVAAAALGPQGYGTWNALNLIYDYGVYASAGALQGLDLELPAAVHRGDRPGATARMAGAAGVAAAGTAAFAAILLSAVALGAVFPGVPPSLHVLMMLAAALQIAFQYLASALRAHGRFEPISAAHAVQALVGGGLGVALVFRYGIAGLLAGWLAGTAIALVGMRRAVPEAPLRPAGLDAGLALARSGLPMFAYFVAMTGLRSVDRMALLHFGGAQSLGLYGPGLMAFGLAIYLPESAGFVLFPRLVAAARGARDAEATRAECLRAQRALCAFMPVVGALVMAAAGPLIAGLLPAFQEGLPALRALAVGAVFVAAATLPGYALLAASRFRTLLAIGIGATLFQAALVAVTAWRAPHATAVGIAAAGGLAVFAACLLLAAGRFFRLDGGARARLLAEGVVPGAWLGAASLLVFRFGDDASWRDAVLRALALGVATLPVALAMARGLALRETLSRLRG